MSGGLAITTEWESLDEGSPEERACFAALGICWQDIWLTEGRDAFVNTVRTAPRLSSYHFAQWLAWNWWRLRWEPRSRNADWVFAHKTSTIGEGYVWPNITIFSDGERTAWLAKPSSHGPETPYRYINDVAAVMPSRTFEVVVDDFIERVRGRLRAEGIGETNLDRVSRELADERQDSEISKRRRFEALLGHDPDEADDTVLQRLVIDARKVGANAMNELAADRPTGGILTTDALATLAIERGFDAAPNDSFRLASGTGLPRPSDVAAWKLGQSAARSVREQAGLGHAPISNRRLGELFGIDAKVFKNKSVSDSSIGYALDRNATNSRVVLRSRYETGRRFELARLLGDRILGGGGEKLFPVTKAHTYRQKMQRSFAAELLSPFDSVIQNLNGDYSEEAQQRASDYFCVSPLTIGTMLANRGLIDREELEDFEARDAAAA